METPIDTPMDTPAVMTNKRVAAIPGGFGAGVGAAVVMMLVMGFLRFISNTITIPELMEESLIRLTGGRIESFFINKLGVGGKALLLVRHFNKSKTFSTACKFVFNDFYRTDFSKLAKNLF